MASSRPIARIKNTIDNPVWNGCDDDRVRSGFTTVVVCDDKAMVDSWVPPSGIPPVTVSRLPTEPGWTEELGVPAPAEVPAVCGSCVEFWVPVPAAVVGSVINY